MKTLFAILLLSTAAARAQFDKPVQELDIPNDADFVKVLYEFKNGTDKPIHYQGVVADCDCVQVEVVPEDSAKNGFQPGEVGALSITMHVSSKINRASLYVGFRTGELIEHTKLSLRMNRLPEIALSSDKLYVAAESSDLTHRVKCLSGSLADCELRFDEKAVEAHIDGAYICVRGLKKGRRKEFVEIVRMKDGKERIAGMLEINFADEK